MMGQGREAVDGGLTFVSEEREVGRRASDLGPRASDLNVGYPTPGFRAGTL